MNTFEEDLKKLVEDDKNCFTYKTDEECLKKQNCEIYEGYNNGLFASALYSDIGVHCKPKNITPKDKNITYWNQYASHANKNPLSSPYGEFIKATYPNMDKGILEKTVIFRKVLLQNKPNMYDFITYQSFPIMVEKFPNESIEYLYKLWYEFCDICSKLPKILSEKKMGMLTRDISENEQKLQDYISNASPIQIFESIHSMLSSINPIYKNPIHTVKLLKMWSTGIYNHVSSNKMFNLYNDKMKQRIDEYTKLLEEYEKLPNEVKVDPITEVDLSNLMMQYMSSDENNLNSIIFSSITHKIYEDEKSPAKINAKVLLFKILLYGTFDDKVIEDLQQLVR